MARPRKDDKRARILQAAVKMFARKGYFAARVSEIAKKAGVADGTIYLYFRSKEDLLVSLFDEVMAAHLEAGPRRAEGRSRARPRACSPSPSTTCGSLGENRDLAVVFQVELRQSTKFMERFTASWLQDYFQLLYGVIEEGQRAGIFRADLPRKLVAKAIFGALDEMVTSFILSGRTMISPSSPRRSWTSSCAGWRSRESRPPPTGPGRRRCGAGRQVMAARAPSATSSTTRSTPSARRPPTSRSSGTERGADISSDEFRTAVEEISMGLRELGVAQGRPGGHPLREPSGVGLRRPRHARARRPSTFPSTPTLTAAQVLYILNDSEAKVCFVSTAGPGQEDAGDPRPGARPSSTSCSSTRPRCAGTLPLVGAPRARAGRPWPRIRSRAGAGPPRCKPEDLATLIYTSGTTGDPKGVMLTHSNLVSNVLAGVRPFAGMGPCDTALSFLPLCHVFERMGGHYLMLYNGVTIAYAESVEKVPENMLEVQPSLMLSVPRLYEKIYARVHEKVAADPPAAAGIFRWALGVGRERFRHQVEGTPAGLGLRACSAPSRTASSSRRSGRARAGSCASSSPAARRCRARSPSSSAPWASRSWRATASPRRARSSA